MNHRKALEFKRTVERIGKHLELLEQRMELATPRCDLVLHVELIVLLHERTVELSGGTLETTELGQKIEAIARRVEDRPHLQLVR